MCIRDRNTRPRQHDSGDEHDDKCFHIAAGLTISADRHVVSVRIPERELPCLSVRVHVGFLFEPSDESACSLRCNVEIVDAEEQEETVTRRPLIWTHQGWMLVRTPLVEAEQDGSIRIQDLTKVVMARRRLGLAKERLVPFEATGNVADADDRPRAFHRISGPDCFSAMA